MVDFVNASKQYYLDYVTNTEKQLNIKTYKLWKFISKKYFDKEIPRVITLIRASSADKQTTANLFSDLFSSLIFFKINSVWKI